MKNTIIAVAIGLFLATGLTAQEFKKIESVKPDEGFLIESVIKEKVPPKDQRSKDVETELNQQSNTYIRPDKKTRLNRYIKRTVGPVALLKEGASAGFSTIVNRPEEWERTGTGFARRFASNVGENAIEQTTIYTLDEALELDSNYYKSEKKDFKSRLSNALLSTVTARNKNGKRVFGTPRIAGKYASGIISREVWYPQEFDYKDGLRSGTISLGFDAAFNIFREFFLK